MIKSTGAVVLPSPGSATNDLAAADIRDIRPLVDVPLGWEWVTWVVVGVIGSFILFNLWNLWKSRPPAISSLPYVSPQQKAHQQLDAALRLLSDPKLFCSTVSDAVRGYLEERFRFRAPERTTEEFLSELQHSSHLNEEQKKTLADFLERCDLVKFARFEPAETELKGLHSVAHRLVDETHLTGDISKEAPEADPEQQRQRRATADLEAKRQALKSGLVAALVAAFGAAMFVWSDVSLAREPEAIRSGPGWHTVRHILEAIWSKPVGTAIMALGVVHLLEGLIRSRRRVKR